MIAYKDTNFLNLNIILTVAWKETRSLMVLQFLWTTYDVYQRVSSWQRNGTYWSLEGPMSEIIIFFTASYLVYLQLKGDWKLVVPPLLVRKENFIKKCLQVSKNIKFRLDWSFCTQLSALKNHLDLHCSHIWCLRPKIFDTQSVRIPISSAYNQNTKNLALFSTFPIVLVIFCVVSR